MFTGCSHAGVVNASKHAVELGGGAPLYAVMGGFHLADADAEAANSCIFGGRIGRGAMIHVRICSSFRCSNRW